MNRKIWNGLLLLAGTPFFLTACNSAEGNEAKETATKEFCLTDTLATMIKVDEAHLKPVQNKLRLSGKVTFDEQKVFKVFPLVGGFVQDVKVEIGDYVQKGQVLAILKSGEVAGYEEQLTSAKSALRVAQKNVDVSSDMFKAGLVSEKDLIAAQQEKKNAEASLKRMKQIFNIYSIGKNSDYIVKAPASGFIVEKKINNNMQVRPDNADNIFTISSMNEIWVMANVYESDIAKVKEGYEADVTTLSYPDKVYKGKIDKIFNVLDPQTRVMKVRVRLQNAGYELKPEMFANVNVMYPENRRLVAVPAKAVIFDRSQNYVMVYRKRCDIDTRKVDVYQTVGDIAYLNEGLKDGEKVISKYQLLVYDALND